MLTRQLVLTDARGVLTDACVLTDAGRLLAEGCVLTDRCGTLTGASVNTRTGVLTDKTRVNRVEWHVHVRGMLTDVWGVLTAAGVPARRARVLTGVEVC